VHTRVYALEFLHFPENRGQFGAPLLVGVAVGTAKAHWSADAVGRSGRQHGRNRHPEILDGSAGSQTPRMHGNSTNGNQEIPVPPVAVRKQRAGLHVPLSTLHAALYDPSRMTRAQSGSLFLLCVTPSFTTRRRF